jgi:hypothetical protein
MEREKKRAQIEALGDEVNELHPLLDQLLRKLDGVTYLEYTHGPHEMGADFVVERVDSGIGKSSHIGIVVKAEKILQNFTDVERQIDECGNKRFIRAGIQEVRLPEVWVISSKGYSQNAKIKISEKFSTRTVHFFDTDWIVDRVDELLPWYWYQLPTATGAYLGNLSRNIAELDGQTSVLLLPGLHPKYIELDVEEIDTDRYKKTGGKKKTHLVNLSDELLKNKISLLEAEMGFGKSKLARKIAADFANPEVLKATGFIPIFQPFKLFAELNHFKLDAFIESKLGASCFAEAKASGSKFLLVLDGIDEADSDPDLCREVIGNLVAQVRELDTVHVLLTSRPFKLLEEIPGITTSAKRYQIRPISTAKLFKFLREVCEEANLPRKLYEDIAKSDLFRQLPQNPIAASLLSNLLAQQRGDLPSNLTELYSKSIEFMLGRWDEKRALATEKLYKTVERLARHLARFMIENRLIYISREEAKSMCAQFMGERNIGIPVNDAFEYLLDRSHVLGQLDESGTIFFRHRSFAEYLFALDAHAHRNMQVDDRAFHPYWMNVMFFYVGLLGECPDLLKTLAALKVSDERSRWARLWQMGNYLLAGYQSPYRVTEDSLDMIFTEAASLYSDVMEGHTTTKLNDLPEMKLLWLFSALMKYCYGYDFFRPALETAMLKIDSSVVTDDRIKQLAIFFVASTLAEIGTNEGLVFLVKSYKTESLPLSLSLAVQCETEFGQKNFANDPLIKRHEKKLKKLLSTDKLDNLATQHRLDELFEKPLRLAHGAGKLVTPPKKGGV